MGKGMQEREISIWDMFWAVCLKWRSIIACAIIFALLAGGFSYYKSEKEVQTVNNSIDIEGMREALSVSEQLGVDMYFRQLEAYESQLEYDVNSPLMSLNPNEFYVGVVSYYIDNNYEVKYPIIATNNNVYAIVDAYKAQLETEQFEEELNDVLNKKKNFAYGMEMIDCENIYSGHLEEEQGRFSISVYAKTKEECMDLMELVKKYVGEGGRDIKREFGEHELVMLQDGCQCISSDILWSYQKNNIDKLQNCTNNIQSLEKNFNAAQEAYMLAREQLTSDEEQINIPAQATMSKKMILLGAMAGAFLTFVIWAICYLFDNRLRFADDFERLYNCVLLGAVPGFMKKRKKAMGFLDDLFLKIRHYGYKNVTQEEAVDMIITNIRISMQYEDDKEILVTGAGYGEDEERVYKALCDKAKDSDIKLVSMNSILCCAESLEKLARVKKIVFIEKVGKSQYQEIQKEIDVCKQQGAKLIGCLLMY